MHVRGAFDLEDLLAVSSYLGIPLDIRTIEAQLWKEEHCKSQDTLSYEYRLVTRRPPTTFKECLHWDEDGAASLMGTDWLSTVTLTRTSLDGTRQTRRFRGGVLVLGLEDRQARWETPTVVALRPHDANTRTLEAVLYYASDEAIFLREDLLATVPNSHNIERTGELAADELTDLHIFFRRRSKLLALPDKALADATASTSRQRPPPVPI